MRKLRESRPLLTIGMCTNHNSVVNYTCTKHDISGNYTCTKVYNVFQNSSKLWSYWDYNLLTKNNESPKL